MGDFFTVASLVFVVGSGIRLATPFLSIVGSVRCV